jgi:hypothetical protein
VRFVGAVVPWFVEVLWVGVIAKPHLAVTALWLPGPTGPEESLIDPLLLLLALT